MALDRKIAYIDLSTGEVEGRHSEGQFQGDLGDVGEVNDEGIDPSLEIQRGGDSDGEGRGDGQERGERIESPVIGVIPLVLPAPARMKLSTLSLKLTSPKRSPWLLAAISMTIAAVTKRSRTVVRLFSSADFAPEARQGRPLRRDESSTT